jgi:hypothetical protein
MGIETKSLHIESNNTNDICRDKNGQPLEGTIVTEDYFIHRFRNGLLDGDTISTNGLVNAMPAVEGFGHLEYWRKGKLHRDQGLPAVIAERFTHKEWWENGKRIK